MISLVILLAIASVCFFFASTFWDAKELLKNSSIVIASVACMTYISVFLMSEQTPSFAFGFIIILIAILLFYINKNLNSSNLKIKANQQRYFDEVNANMIYNFYKNRKIVKKKSVEIKVNEDEKKLIKNVGGMRFLSTNFWINLSNLKLNTIKKYKDIHNIKLYSIIFNKINEFIKKAEIELDFQEILEKNGYIAEYFLIYLWEHYTKRENISVANLQILSENFTQNELLGALDISLLNNVKFNGATIYYLYMKHHDRISNFLEQRIA